MEIHLLTNICVWNCGKCMFIVIQNVLHLKQASSLNLIFQLVQRDYWSVYYLFLEFSSLYWMNILKCRKNVLFTCTCKWIGISPWDWKQYLFPLHPNAHLIQDAESQKHIINRKKFVLIIGPQVWRKIVNRLNNLCYITYSEYNCMFHSL